MMGFTPDQVRAMSLAEVQLAISGFIEMRNAEAGVGAATEPPSPEELEELQSQYAEFLRNHPDI